MGTHMHTVPAPDLDDGGKSEGTMARAKMGCNKGKPAPVQGGANGGAHKQEVAVTVGQQQEVVVGQFDPNDPLVPLPEGGVTTTRPKTQPQPKDEANGEAQVGSIVGQSPC